MTFVKLGKPGNLDGIKDEVFANYDNFYGPRNWKLSDNGILLVNELPKQANLYFVTNNSGNMFYAQRALGGFLKISKIDLNIEENSESIETIAIKKARVGYAVLCRPVIADDYGFVIPSMNGWPGSKVARELQDKGIDYFTNLAKNGPINASFSMVLTYLDSDMQHWPAIFRSNVNGKLTSELKGDLSQSFFKSPLAAAFLINGQERTIAEMTESEYKSLTTTNRWLELKTFLENKLIERLD